MKLDQSEKKLLKEINEGKWTPVKDLKAYKKQLREAAAKTMLKDQTSHFYQFSFRLR